MFMSRDTFFINPGHSEHPPILLFRYQMTTLRKMSALSGKSHPSRNPTGPVCQFIPSTYTRKHTNHSLCHSTSGDFFYMYIYKMWLHVGLHVLVALLVSIDIGNNPIHFYKWTQLRTPYMYDHPISWSVDSMVSSHFAFSRFAISRLAFYQSPSLI
jgi:hypothetical protein